MIVLPLFEGAVKVTVASAFPRVAITDVGASGTVNGVLFTVALLVPCPAEFTADTRKLYNEPLVSPVTVEEVAVEAP